MSGDVTYTLTSDDYVVALKTAFGRSIRRWGALRGWLIVAAACGVIGGFSALGTVGVWGKLIIVCGFLAWGAIMIPLCWGFCYLLLPRQARRLFRQQRSLHSPWTYRWSETGLENEGETGLVRFKWGDLHAWTRGRKVFLFYANDALFYMLPLHALSEAEADELESLLERRGPKRR